MPLPTVPQCGACGIWQHCRSPKMKPTGEGKKKILIVAEAPGENEDKQGIQLVGNAGRHLMSLLRPLGINMRRDCWLTNACICRPTDDDGKNRRPTNKEIDFCRPNLRNTIRDLKPHVIIPLGDVAVRSVMELAYGQGIDHKDVGAWVGWRIPSIVLNAWVCPTYHPSFLLHEQSQVAELIVGRHLRAAAKLKGKPHTTPPDYLSQVRVETDHVRAAAAVRAMMRKGGPLAFDFETTTLKPDGPHAHILCCSVSDGVESIAFPWHGDAVAAVDELTKSGTPLVAANSRFEDRWTRNKLGHWVKNWLWDTVLGAHWGDCRHGINGLKFQAFVLLGMPDYSSHLEPYMKQPNSNRPNRLREVDPLELLKYNGLDSILEMLVAKKQMEALP